MWLWLAIGSALSLGVYDIFKKVSVTGNNVLGVLFWNTTFCALIMLPFIGSDLLAGATVLGGGVRGHAMILMKSAIVLTSWTLGYYSIKHLPLTITGPITATRPVIVLIGALLIFGERLNLLQWAGVLMGFASLLFISRLGRKEGEPGARTGLWLAMAAGATLFGAISALYDKYLLRHYEPLQVQAWYSVYQCVIMGVTLLIISRRAAGPVVPFRWRWTIPGIALFLSAADMAYFYALSDPSAMVSVVSMIRRGSVIVSFFFGVIALHERHVRAKLLDLALLIVGLILLVLGSR
ncbi:MAG: DMT family transporter [Muribaculaceae bacterium]|nr:DMT family transporter [Muribaculaceae bacterium]